ncbi:MAG: hydroxyphenylacetyl-CoA thioesterase PaaI [Gammaproteobacteria bacterium]|nr:hydroxyphenylacetyl-CoA thioesterase PaaI [Gammaproteobacteria bacterium]
MDELEKARQCAATMLANDNASKSLGIEIEIPNPGSAIARMTVTEQMLNGFAVCHGGYLFALADTAFAFACNAYDRLTLAAGANIDFLRSAQAGDSLVATATERNRGGRLGLYDVRVSNQNDEEIAIFHGKSYATKKPLLRDIG